MDFQVISHYIDPGTGSMLFTLIVGVLSASYFFFRRLAIKIKFVLSGGSAKAASSEKLPLVIFSDDKRYWNVFKPICDELERRQLKAAYWTASPDDPALQESYEHVTCEFIGEGNKAFARLNMMSANICLSTTPGLDVLQWKRSKDVDFYVHTLHAVGSAAGYRMFGLDYFDAVLLSGQFQVEEIRELERLRKLPSKELEIVGCTYLDVMDERLKALPKPKTHNTAVLLAPSWGESSILHRFGARVLQALVNTGFDVIVRPHPQTASTEKPMLDKLMAEFPNSDQLTWDFSTDNFETLNKADIMISDFSGVVFDYALVFDKPVIFTEASFDPAVYDAAWLDKPLWKFSVYPTLGEELSEEQFDDMRAVIERVLNSPQYAKGRERAREQAWAHRGESVTRTVDYLEDVLLKLQEKAS